ncbi:MAG: hypothetical protein HY606_03335 [Planctomycetes bacterium]|nr:hypothetical protein [Planctomycetota bacterium]
MQIITNEGYTKKTSKLLDGLDFLPQGTIIRGKGPIPDEYFDDGIKSLRELNMEMLNVLLVKPQKTDLPKIDRLMIIEFDGEEYVISRDRQLTSEQFKIFDNVEKGVLGILSGAYLIPAGQRDNNFGSPKRIVYCKAGKADFVVQGIANKAYKMKNESLFSGLKFMPENSRFFVSYDVEEQEFEDILKGLKQAGLEELSYKGDFNVTPTEAERLVVIDFGSKVYTVNPAMQKTLNQLSIFDTVENAVQKLMWLYGVFELKTDK